MDALSLKDEISLRKAKATDRTIEILMVSYFIFGIVISFFYQTYFIGILLGLTNLLFYFGTKFMFKNSTLHHYVASLVLGVFMAQFIYQMHGLFEMHFTAFIPLIILFTYENWKVYLPLAIFVVIHHSLFAYIQYLGFINQDPSLQQVFFTQADYMDLTTFIFHAALFALAVFISAYYAYVAHLNSEENISRIEDMQTAQLLNEQKALEMEQLTAELKISKAKEDEERFIVNGVNQLTDLLRRKGNNYEELATEAIIFIVKHLEANQGAFFIAEDGEDGDEVLRLQGCYAYDRLKFADKVISIGEGLVGQSFLEKDSIYITDVPKEYIQITSGLGESLPKNVLIVPVKNENGIFGVIEIAAFEELKEYKQTFVNRVAENLAGAIQTLKVNLRTQLLLEESKKKSVEMESQTEELRAQEEEMRQNMEEMEATQEQMQEMFSQQERRAKKITENREILNSLTKNSNIQNGNITVAMELITKALGEVLGVKRAAVWSYSAQNESILLEKMYLSAENRFDGGATFSKKDLPIYFESVESEEVIVAKHADKHPSLVEFRVGYLDALDIRSMLDVPFFLDGNVGGVICCEQQNATKDWSEEDVDFAKSVADIITIAFKSYQTNSILTETLEQKKLYEGEINNMYTKWYNQLNRLEEQRKNK